MQTLEELCVCELVRAIGGRVESCELMQQLQTLAETLKVNHRFAAAIFGLDK